MRIDSSGNVNIGATTNDFGSKFGVTSTTSFAIAGITSAVAGSIFQKTTTGAANNILLLTGNSFNYGIVGAVTANGTASGDVYTLGYTASAGTAATQVLNWTSTGNVGIGVASPAARLDVSTTTSYGGIKVNANDGGTISFYQPLSNASARNFRIAPNYEAWGSLDFQKSADNASAPTTTILSIGATGKLNLLGGSASGGGVGITFPATQSASSDANTLDDYEEGTFTPTVVGVTTAGTATYSFQLGSYTKIGNLVYVNIYLAYSGGTGTGQLRIAGLPFTSAGSLLPVASVYLDNIAVTAAHYPQVIMNASATTVDFYQSAGGGSGALPYDAAGTILLSLTYRV
jgi:hypothetical protein